MTSCGWLPAPFAVLHHGTELFYTLLLDHGRRRYLTLKLVTGPGDHRFPFTTKTLCYDTGSFSWFPPTSNLTVVVFLLITAGISDNSYAFTTHTVAAGNAPSGHILHSLATLGATSCPPGKCGRPYPLYKRLNPVMRCLTPR